MKAKSPRRTYSCTDPNLLQQANLNLSLLTAHLSDFTAEDESLNNDYPDEYAAAINAAESLPSDAVVKATLIVLRKNVTTARRAVAAKMRQVRYHVLEAFGEDAAVQYKFGLPQWDTVRHSVDATLQAFRTLHTVALEHETELAATGFDAVRIAGIETVAQALGEAATEHKLYMSGRGKLTADRIGAYNAVHARIARINALAQIVYADRPAQRKQFVFNAQVARIKRVAWKITLPDAASTVLLPPFRPAPLPVRKSRKAKKKTGSD